MAAGFLEGTSCFLTGGGTTGLCRLVAFYEFSLYCAPALLHFLTKNVYMSGMSQQRGFHVA